MARTGNKRILETLHGEVVARRMPLPSPVTDEALGDRLAETFEATESLAKIPAENFDDVLLKLEVLCGRLQEELQLAYSGDVLTWFLAEGIQQDVRMLIACARLVPSADHTVYRNCVAGDDDPSSTPDDQAPRLPD